MDATAGYSMRPCGAKCLDDAREVARCMQKHARDKSNTWVWFLGITDECQMFRYIVKAVASSSNQLPMRSRCRIFRARIDHQRPPVGHMFPL